MPGARYGLAPGYTLANHLQLVDIAARFDRAGKASLPREAASSFVRLGLDGSHWRDILEALSRRPGWAASCRLDRLAGRLLRRPSPRPSHPAR
ncbi:hypothetical protein [Aquisphaera insulae]|uniref:hypothetical protein n=1 Tax=Aquisphaera insulae TaxID=2712864 RepID=UPI0013EDF0D9|nr:hypothetical protein [Aquisphaera insulae]